MKISGLIKGLMQIGGETVVTISTKQPAKDFERMTEKDLDIEVKVHREKRSLDANAYYHLLCGKIAKVMGLSMTQVCNRMIAEYGQMDPLAEVGMRDYIDYTKIEKIHLRPTTQTYMKGDELMRIYQVMRGSHTYDTKEMSDLIKGVVSEAEELGIPTMTPDEEARLLARWGEANG